MAKWCNSFTLFCSEHRKTLLLKHQEKSNSDITKLLSQMWKDLDIQEKKQYIVVAAQMRKVIRIFFPFFFELSFIVGA